MDTRASPEEPGAGKRSRWNDAPTATPSQPEAQPQMACLHHNGYGSEAQSTADVDSCNCRWDSYEPQTPPSPDRINVGPGVIHYDSGWTRGAAFRSERLVVVARDRDDGRMAQWIYHMFSGRWTQSQRLDDDTGTGAGGVPYPGLRHDRRALPPRRFPNRRGMAGVQSPFDSPLYGGFLSGHSHYSITHSR